MDGLHHAARNIPVAPQGFNLTIMSLWLASIASVAVIQAKCATVSSSSLEIIAKDAVLLGCVSRAQKKLGN